MSESLVLNIDLHYYLQEEGVHQMNAKVHNECEYFFLQSLDVLKQYVGDFDVDVKVPKEGGVISEFVLSLLDSKAFTFAEGVFTAFISVFTSQKNNQREGILKDIEIIEKIKANSYTKEEVEILIGRNKTLSKFFSEYYKSAEKEPQLRGIGSSVINAVNHNSSSSLIKRSDFRSHIIEKETHENSNVIEGCTIAIISPILQKGHSKVWQGIYSGKTIDFKIEDKEFLVQVYNNEIKFGSATTIKCSLQIKKKVTRISDEDVSDEKYEYSVKDVQSWIDDENYQKYSKKYRRIKEQEKQLSMFPIEET